VRTWKNVKKRLSLRLCDPRSKHIPHASRSVQTSRIRKKSSGVSMGQTTPGNGRPSSVSYGNNISGTALGRRYYNSR